MKENDKKNNYLSVGAKASKILVEYENCVREREIKAYQTYS
jgi:hypothetical protein